MCVWCIDMSGQAILLSPIIGDSVVCERISHGNHVVDDWILIIHYTPNAAKMFSTSSNKTTL